MTTRNFSPVNALSQRLDENITFSDDDTAFLAQITKLSRDTARASNNKDVGLYMLTELLNGQQFFGANPQHNRSIFRKVVQCGALPNAGTSTTAHSINGITKDSRITRVYGTACDPVAIKFIPIPNVGNYEVEVLVDDTNIYLTTVANLSMFTDVIMVLEYWKF
jgi:hypothetical protein